MTSVCSPNPCSAKHAAVSVDDLSRWNSWESNLLADFAEADPLSCPDSSSCSDSLSDDSLSRPKRKCNRGENVKFPISNPLQHSAAIVRVASENDDAQLAEDVNMTFVKRQWRKRRTSPFPAIIKRDVRRHLGQMFANALNSADPVHLDAFLQQFCVLSCRMLDAPCEMMAAYFNQPVQKLDGLEAISRHLQQQVANMPDVVFRVWDGRIIRGLDQPGSRVVMRITVAGTQQMLQLRLGEATHIFPADVVETFRQVGHPLGNAQVLGQAPVAVELCGLLTLSLDVDHHIYRIELTGKGCMSSQSKACSPIAIADKMHF